ncbi:dienelactone hydrolase family protein [Rhizodiscina lignyota]|uniref:Dienelactone hydrolase family protein n=1 Tax=Rhizodiscina lignyota TaxID=1504668 RepID=A0A9P4ILV7_9PEZI|nr:dienelactone hydrolase family protein [Rhizodiscina lignyota]
MASNPPGRCCTIGVKHEGEAVGEMGKIGDFETYFSYPEDKSTTNAILLVTDVLGHGFINAQLIADQFAANGYFVVMPDLFYGDAIPLNRPEGFDIMKWMKPHGPDSVDPIIAKSLEEMRGKYGCKNIGGVGYCFGAKYVVRFLKKGKIDVGYSAHPSFVTADELKAIEGPFAITAAETDHIFPAEKRHESEVILKDTKLPYQIFLFSGVEHGFAVRSDITQRHIKLAKEQAFLQAVHWFDEFVKS